jgi:hypothetical protein
MPWANRVNSSTNDQHLLLGVGYNLYYTIDYLSRVSNV